MLIAEDDEHHCMDGWYDEVPPLWVGEEIEQRGKGHEDETEEGEDEIA